MKQVQVDDETIYLANVDGKFYAIGNVCKDEGGPLEESRIDAYEVECPWHGSKFDVRTGEVTNPPATEPESTYVVKIDGDNMLIRRHSR